MEMLRRLRTERGLSQAKLAARAELDPSTVNQIERGAREASPATLRKLADALNVSIADLLEDPSPKAQAPLPLDDAPSLKQLHDAAGCRTDFLVRPEARWWAAWPRTMRPHEALENVRQMEAEFAAVEPLIAERERNLPITERLTNGRYRQAYMRWLNGVMAATEIAREAGEIGPEETLNDLDERAVRELEQYRLAG
jgi:transcriptional regulator with XRE-family HTH domain